LLVGKNVQQPVIWIDRRSPVEILQIKKGIKFRFNVIEVPKIRIVMKQPGPFDQPHFLIPGVYIISRIHDKELNEDKQLQPAIQSLAIDNKAYISQEAVLIFLRQSYL